MLTGAHGLQYRQVDVFPDDPNGGNGLAVFWNTGTQRRRQDVCNRNGKEG